MDLFVGFGHINLVDLQVEIVFFNLNVHFLALQLRVRRRCSFRRGCAFDVRFPWLHCWLQMKPMSHAMATMNAPTPTIHPTSLDDTRQAGSRFRKNHSCRRRRGWHLEVKRQTAGDRGGDPLVLRETTRVARCQSVVRVILDR